MYAGSMLVLVYNAFQSFLCVVNKAYSDISLKLIGFLDDLLQCLNHFDDVSSRLVNSLFFGKGADECFNAAVYDLHD